MKTFGLARMRLFTVALCSALVLMRDGVVARGASAVALRFDPATAQVTSGQTITLALWVDNVEGLQRIELHLRYDPSALQVQDANLGRAGVQIQSGPIFCAICNPWNEAADGEIHFVAYRDPNTPFSGSNVAVYITFLVTATRPETYTLAFDRALTRLLDSQNQSIVVGRFVDANLVLLPSSLVLSGWLTRQGTSSDERSGVSAVLYPAAAGQTPLSWGRTCTEATGAFGVQTWGSPQSLPAGLLPSSGPPSSPPCTSCWIYVRFKFTGYLGMCEWHCAGSGIANIGWRELYGGDINGDGCINILDTVRIIADYGRSVGVPCYVPYAECPPGYTPPHTALPSDLNGDCQVNILDLSQAAGNFGLCGNCP